MPRMIYASLTLCMCLKRRGRMATPFTLMRRRRSVMLDMPETAAAFSKAITGLEAGRRVGWARSFAAEEREQETARDLNIARSDLDIMSKFAGFLFGLVESVAPGAEALAVNDYRAVMSFLPQQALSSGRQQGRTWLAKIEERANPRLAKEKAKKVQNDEHSKAFQKARLVERRALMREFGIPSEDALMDWLRQFPTESE